MVRATTISMTWPVAAPPAGAAASVVICAAMTTSQFLRCRSYGTVAYGPATNRLHGGLCGGGEAAELAAERLRRPAVLPGQEQARARLGEPGDRVAEQTCRGVETARAAAVAIAEPAAGEARK